MSSPVMNAPAQIIGLAIEHRTSEDWLLHLPLRIGASVTTTAVALAGAQAQMRLAGKLRNQATAEILFRDTRCRIEGHEIVLETDAGFFNGKAGTYKGEVLVRLPNGFNFVSHEIELDLIEGLGWVP